MTARPPSNQRPPIHPVPTSIPRWEMEFCTDVCSIPWKKVCETKKEFRYHRNVLYWNDSEARDAFQAAKSLYWATINGLTFKTPLRDPDLFIDVVDYDAPVDPELIADLYKGHPAEHDANKDTSLLEAMPVVPTGWDDAEDTKGDTSKLNAANLVKLPVGWSDLAWDEAWDPEVNTCELNHPNVAVWAVNSEIECSRANKDPRLLEDPKGNTGERNPANVNGECDDAWNRGWRSGVMQHDSWGSNFRGHRRNQSRGNVNQGRGRGSHFRNGDSRHQNHHRGGISKRANYQFENSVYAK